MRRRVYWSRLKINIFRQESCKLLFVWAVPKQEDKEWKIKNENLKGEEEKKYEK